MLFVVVIVGMLDVVMVMVVLYGYRLGEQSRIHYRSDDQLSMLYIERTDQ